MKSINHINELLHFPFQALARLDVFLSSLQLAILVSTHERPNSTINRLLKCFPIPVAYMTTNDDTI